MTPLTDRQLQDFQAALAWKTGYELPDGRFLGAPGKRGSIVRGSDARVRAVRDRFQSRRKAHPRSRLLRRRAHRPTRSTLCGNRSA